MIFEEYSTGIKFQREKFVGNSVTSKTKTVETVLKAQRQIEDASGQSRKLRELYGLQKGRFWLVYIYKDDNIRNGDLAVFNYDQLGACTDYQSGNDVTLRVHDIRRSPDNEFHNGKAVYEAYLVSND